MQPYCSTDFHSTNHLGAAVSSSALVHSPPNNSPSNSMSSSGGCLAKFPTEMDALNSSYPNYNNWSNGYNNYQYGSCPAPPAQAQYPVSTPAAAPMLIYPQVYSTVNQNQIHLHLHGTDKIEQYLSSAESGLAISSARGAQIPSGIEIGIGTSDNVIMETDDREPHLQQPQAQHDQQTEMNPTAERGADDPDAVDPGSVWRPY